MNKKKVKVLVVGDPGVGKTVLCQVYSGKGPFTSDYNMTAGGDVFSKVIPFEKENKDIELFLFDIGGQDCYENIYLPILKNPDLVMLVYDCTNAETFKGAIKWLDKVKKLNNNKSYSGVLVGTKSEHKNAKEVETDEGRQYAKKLGLQFFEVSTALKQNIEQPFQYLAQKALSLSSYSIS